MLKAISSSNPSGTLSSAYTNDSVYIVRNGVAYLVPISAVLAASSPPGSMNIPATALLLGVF